MFPGNGCCRPKADGEPWAGGTYGWTACPWARAAAARGLGDAPLLGFPGLAQLPVAFGDFGGDGVLLRLDLGELVLDAGLGGLEFGVEPRGVGDELVHRGLLGLGLVPGGLFPRQRGVGLGLEVRDFGFDGCQPGLRVDVGGVLLGELVHRGVLAAQGLVREVDGVRQAAALVRAEEQREVGRDAAGLVRLRGDLPDQLPGVRDLLLVRFELLGDFGLVLLRQVHAGREGLHLLDRSGHPALGIQQGLLGAGELALVQDQVRRGLRDPAVHEFEGMLDPGRLVPERGLLVLEVVGECHRTRSSHGCRPGPAPGWR